MSKRAKEAKKKQKVTEIKEIRLSPNIDKHDLEVKAKMATKFLDAGNKIKISMRFRGRELNFINQGKEIMKGFQEMIENSQIEKEAKMEGKSLTMFLSPKQK
ncbi:translation initiation factor IF-3 [Clostridium sp. CAG:921]|nr:translation initiation factor IF-3 [Clostridium sp. CAG:921]